MKNGIFKTLIVIALVLVLSISAVAWFCEIEDVNPDVNGSAMTGYFASGNGSKESPYILNNAKHVYNLAWLQYMGYLNQKDSSGNIIQLYFKLDEDINMADIILPPIGTKQFPFVGHFDGGGNCISNLTVSNYLSGEDNQLKIVQRPLSVTEITQDTVSIVGFFGVVGAYGDTTLDMLANDSDKTDITQKVNSVHDLFLENLTVRTETTSSLIGLVAGYANGSIVNVGVSGNSDIQLGTKTQPLQPEEVEDLTYAVSFYSLIGQYNATNIIWKDAPTGGSGEGGGEENAPGAGWGGSINMLELKKRTTYITNATEFIKENYSSFYVNAFGYYGWYSNTQAYSYSYTSRSNRAYFLDGTAMPLSINQSIFEEPPIVTNDSNEYPIGLKYYEDAAKEGINEEPVLKSNSGYVVGGGTNQNNSVINYWPEYPLGFSNSQGLGIYKSLASEYVTRGAFPENDSNFVMHMLTIGADGNTYVIQDDYNTQGGSNKAGTYFSANASSYTFARFDSDILNFKKYQQTDATTGIDTGVRTSFVNSNAGEPLVHGIRFNNKIDLTNLSSQITTVGKVTLLGNDISDYQMLKGAINFSLKEAGTTTTVIGTYSVTAGQNKSLFTVMKVERDQQSGTDITSVKIINQIYERPSPAKGEERYVYVYADGTLSSEVIADDYILKYDRSLMTALNEANALYYFEIPLNAGDYAIGSTTNDNTSAYVLYLDIGANGDKAEGDEDVDNPGTTSIHQIEGITFVDSAKDASEALKELKENATEEDKIPVLSDIYSVVTFKIAISEDGYGKDHGGLTVNFNRSSKTNMTVTETEGDGKDVFTTTLIKDDKELTVTVGPPSS